MKTFMVNHVQSDYFDKARRISVSIAVNRGVVTAEDLRERLPIPRELHHNIVGAVFMTLLQDGLLRRCGHARASWEAANRHHMRRWRATVKSEAWLAQTPELETQYYPEQTELF